MEAHQTPLDPATIEALARKHWEEEGRPEGRAMDHWLRAESELRKLNEVAAPKRQETKSADSLKKQRK
jgi:hypothetical protein